MRRLNDWIDGYLEYTSNSEPKESFRRWAAISTIASVLQRKCCFNWGVEEFFPNMFIVLVGPPAARKGTAMKPARKLLDRLGIRLAADETSRQKLVKALIDTSDIQSSGDIPDIHCSLTIHSSELSVFIGYNNVELLSILCKWFDCESRFRYDTLQRGVEEAANVWVNLFGATTPTLLQSSVPQEAIGSGFASRTVFVYEECEERIVICPALSKEQKEIEEKLLLDLGSIYLMSGRFKLDGRCADEFIEAYSKFRYDTKNHPPFTEPRLSTYLQRRLVQLWKLCMIYSASRGDGMELNMSDYNRSLKTLKDAEEKMPMVFAGLGANPLAKVQVQIMKIVAEKKRVKMDELMSAFYNDVTSIQMGEIMASLEKMKFCQMELSKRELVYTYNRGDENENT